MSLILENFIGSIIKTVIKELNENDNEQLWPLNKWNGYVVLTHRSSAKIKNGVINRRYGKMNNYSNRSDMGNYFWGSTTEGRDNSSIHKSTYYCLVPEEYVYDMMSNEKNYESLKDAVYHEKYVALNWPNTKGAVVVVTLEETPFSYVSYYSEGFSDDIDGLYDKDWNLLISYCLTGDKRKATKMLAQLKKAKDVEIPSCIDCHGWDYDKAMDYYEKNRYLFL